MTSAIQSVPKTTRYAYIDALRGLAILGVFIFHVNNRTKGVPEIISLLSANGNYGVQLFYVASALTLCMSWYNKSVIETRPAFSFAIRRVLRITPMFYCGIIFYSIVFGMGVRGTAAYGIDWKHVVSTIFFVHGWYPTTISSVVPGGWSIAVEMTFYMVLPWLVSHINSFKKSFSYFIVFLFSANLIKFFMSWVLNNYTDFPDYYIVRFLYYWFPYQLPVFLLGFVLYYLIKFDTESLPDYFLNWNKLTKRTQAYILCSTGSVIYILTALLTPPQVHIINSFSYVLFAYSLSLFPIRIFVNRIICYIGQISFSAYLTHFFVLEVSDKYFIKLIENQQYSPLTHYCCLSIAGLIGTVILSAITYNIIEKPGMKCASFLVKKYSS